MSGNEKVKIDVGEVRGGVAEDGWIQVLGEEQGGWC